MKTQWANKLQPGQDVSAYFGIFDLGIGKTKNGAKFLKLSIGDRTGTVEGRVWDPNLADDLNHQLAPGDIVIVRGIATEFNGLQVNIETCQKADRSQVDLNEFRPVTDKNIDEMQQQFTGQLARVGNTYLQQLLQQTFTPTMLTDFCRATAARTIHHAYGGGLLEHTLEVMAYCSKAMEIQGNLLNCDLLLTGAALHDIGKLWEYDQSSLTFQLTEMGKLLGGHVVLGYDFIRDQLALITGFPEELALHLRHLILSHHGQREWGAVEEPRTLEAIALHHADLISARLNQAAQLVKSHQGTNTWTSYDRHLRRSLYVPDQGQQDKGKNI